MEVNYVVVGLVLLGVIILIVWLVRRNLKDKKTLERKLNLFDLEPGKRRKGEN